jgi:hypothetical protein
MEMVYGHGPARLGEAWCGKARYGSARQGKAFLTKKEKRTMRQAIVNLESVSPYSQSRYHNEPKLEKESAADYEDRTWKKRLHINETGHAFIPPMSFKNCLSECAKYLGIQIPGKGKSTYTKHFEAGVLVTEPLVLDLTEDQIKGEWFHVPSDGRRGGTKRVLKCFPCIPQWKGDVLFYILDDTITEQVLRYHLEQAGKFIGVGRFRPRNNGFYGRFKVNDLIVENMQ